MNVHILIIHKNIFTTKIEIFNIEQSNIIENEKEKYI